VRYIADELSQPRPDFTDSADLTKVFAPGVKGISTKRVAEPA